MSEQKLQFRVGLFVIVAGVIAAVLAFRFGELHSLWARSYTIAVHFEEAPGVEIGTPVRKNGIGIGAVEKLLFEEETGGVTLLLEIDERFPLRKDSQARLTRSLLGDASLEFTPGKSREILKPGTRVTGENAADPVEIVARIDQKLSTTLESFTGTSQEWQKVAKNINNLVETKRGTLDVVIEQAAESLHQFTLAMQSANKVLGDPQVEQNLKTTLAAMPEMVADTRRTILAVRSAVAKVDENLANLANVTGPLAQRSASIITKLDGSVGNLEKLLAELNQFSRVLNQQDGSLNLFLSDPDLYRNLNQSAAALQVVLKNLDPVIRDMRVFTDKVARHPELIGVGGALKGSSGLK